MGYVIWGLPSSELDNPPHKYSSHHACFYIRIAKRIDAQMPLSLPRHRREKVGRLQTQGWLLAYAANDEDAAEPRNPEGGPLLDLPRTLHGHYHYHAYFVPPLFLLLAFIILMKFVILSCSHFKLW